MNDIQKTDILLAGVGGQGIVSIAAVIALAAMKKGWHIKQSEVHGMSQRGGAVQSHLRISNRCIFSDLISLCTTDLILSVEPLEALRYLPYLSPHGVVVTASNPVNNIDDYPPMTQIEEAVLALENRVWLDVAALAREAGNPKTSNMVILGAGAAFTGLSDALLKEAISDFFEPKGQKMIEMNLRAFSLGRESVL